MSRLNNIRQCEKELDAIDAEIDFWSDRRHSEFPKKKRASCSRV